VLETKDARKPVDSINIPPMLVEIEEGLSEVLAAQPSQQLLGLFAVSIRVADKDTRHFLAPGR